MIFFIEVIDNLKVRKSQIKSVMAKKSRNKAKIIIIKTWQLYQAFNLHLITIYKHSNLPTWLLERGINILCINSTIKYLSKHQNIRKLLE